MSLMSLTAVALGKKDSSRGSDRRRGSIGRLRAD